MAWYNSSWSYRFKITSDNTKVASSYGYAIIYDLANAPAAFWTHVKAGGVDIRMAKSDGTTELARGIREFDSTNTKGFIYFNADGISTSANTDFYVYYGNADASDYADDNALGMENVFSSSYKFYSTMADTTTSTISDETSNDNHGTKKGANEPIETTSGKVGKAQDFDGTDDYVSTDYTLSMGTNDSISINMWIKTDTKAATRIPIGIGQAVSGGFNRIQINVNTSGNIRFYVRDDVNMVNSYTDTTIDISDNSWYMVTAVFTGTSNKAELFINGSSKGSDTTNTLGSISIGNGFQIGCLYTQDGRELYWENLIDEVGILDAALTANEILTIYNNQSSPSTFWSQGSEETSAAVKDIISGGIIPFSR